MHAFFVKPIDWAVIRLAAARMPLANNVRANTDEAQRMLNLPDFFDVQAVLPPDFAFVNDTEFRFASPIRTPWPENNTVHGRLFRAGKEWERKPAVILLHGWNDVFGYQLRSPWLAWRFARAGFNTAILELPYHLQRRPRGPDSIRNFISEDLLRTVEATRQAIADVRALKHWLLRQGCPTVGLCGYSLGAWIAGLIVCHDVSVHFAVLTTPVAHMERVVRELAFCAPIRRSLDQKPISFGRLDLASHRPKIPKENVLIIEGEHDLFAPKETVEEVWGIWGRPEIWRLPHGHISALMSLSTLQRSVNWVREKAGGGAKSEA